jgi:patatin-like phospholipase/acyl hydrolase
MDFCTNTTTNTGTSTGTDSNNESLHETRGLCLLSLDGGGVRGLSTLYILSGIMTLLNDKRKMQSLEPVKPCEVFDLIGGTSTGGYARLVSVVTNNIQPLTRHDSLIAIMLGRLEMTVEECIEKYKKLMGTVFARKGERWMRMSLNGTIKPRFCSKLLAKLIQGVIENANISANEPFCLGRTDEGSRKCRV